MGQVTGMGIKSKDQMHCKYPNLQDPLINHRPNASG